MNDKVAFWAILLGAAFFEVVADLFFKQWASSSQKWAIWTGIVLYMAGTIGWAYSLRYEQLSKAIVTFMMVNMLLAIAGGCLFFKERLTVANWIGIGLAIVAIILCESGE